MLVLPADAFELASWCSAPKVGAGLLRQGAGKALYTVPWRFIGRHLDARESASARVEFYLDGEVVKTWARVERGTPDRLGRLPAGEGGLLHGAPRSGAGGGRRSSGTSVKFLVEGLLGGQRPLPAPPGPRRGRAWPTDTAPSASTRPVAGPSTSATPATAR